MQRVFVLGSNRKRLMPCHPARAKELMEKGKASVFRRFPFTIIMKYREGGNFQPVILKLDPGSKTTGIAVVVQGKTRNRVVWAAELNHRGRQIKEALDSRRALRHSRRSRKTRHRKARFDNRCRPQGWLPPSLMSRVCNSTTWVRRLAGLMPASGVAMELVKFDMQAMENPEISGVEYQQGEIQGYEIREYLLEKWGRKCAYCGKENTPLQIEHIQPRSKGGTDRVSNLTIACKLCNQKKDNMDITVFLAKKPELLKRIIAQGKAPLRDAAAVNATRWALFNSLNSFGLPVETGSGGKTKFNRITQGLPKGHWIDAACVGKLGSEVCLSEKIKPSTIKATGHGSRQICGTDKYGFPTRHRTNQKIFFGFQTGDMVKATVPKGKCTGTHVGRVLVRASGSFDIQTTAGRVAGVSYKHLKTVHRKDGYAYT